MTREKLKTIGNNKGHIIHTTGKVREVSNTGKPTMEIQKMTASIAKDLIAADNLNDASENIVAVSEFVPDFEFNNADDFSSDFLNDLDETINKIEETSIKPEEKEIDPVFEDLFNDDFEVPEDFADVSENDY